MRIQTGIFKSAIQNSNQPFIDLYKSLSFKTGRKFRKVGNRINDFLNPPTEGPVEFKL
jgi:hypothetical protein